MIICKNCGAEYDDEQDRCPYCGGDNFGKSVQVHEDMMNELEREKKRWKEMPEKVAGKGMSWTAKLGIAAVMMVAINLEPAAVRNDGEKSVWSLTEGRRATVENAKKAADMGVDMIVLTGNPGVGVDNKAITKALADLNEAVGDRVILTAGKMHASGILSEAGEKILTKDIFSCSSMDL